MVKKQEKQNLTTSLRKSLWSQNKKRKIGPQCPEKACGPKARKAIPDHSALKERVVPKQEKQAGTTAPRKSLWSQSKKSKLRPQHSGKACGPKARKASWDHITPERPVVPKQEKQAGTTAPRKGVWSQSKKSKLGPHHSGKACGPKPRKAIPDHSAPKKPVVPKKAPVFTAPFPRSWSAPQCFPSFLW